MNVRELNPSKNQIITEDVVIDVAAFKVPPETSSTTSELLGESKNSDAPGSNLWNTFSQAPRPLFEEFKSALIQGALLAFLIDLSESKIRSYGCTEAQVKSVKFAIDMLFSLYSGSHISTSAENVVFHAMKYYEYSDYHASVSSKSAGAVVSLAWDFSPFGAVKVAVTAAGSFAGNRLSLWATEKVKQATTQWAESKEKKNSGIYMV